MALHIVDLFHGDTGIDFHALKAGGVDGVILKATQGTGYTDPAYADTMARARSVCFPVVGAYHYFDKTAPAVQQVDHFLSVARLKPGEFAALDTEEWTNGTVSRVNQALALLDKALSVKVCHYANRSTFHDLFPQETGRLQWVAAYDAPRPPGALFWQFTERARVAGAAGQVDESIFFGTLAQLQPYLIPGKVAIHG